MAQIRKSFVAFSQAKLQNVALSCGFLSSANRDMVFLSLVRLFSGENSKTWEILMDNLGKKGPRLVAEFCTKILWTLGFLSFLSSLGSSLARICLKIFTSTFKFFKDSTFWIGNRYAEDIRDSFREGFAKALPTLVWWLFPAKFASNDTALIFPFSSTIFGFLSPLSLENHKVKVARFFSFFIQDLYLFSCPR